MRFCIGKINGDEDDDDDDDDADVCYSSTVCCSTDLQYDRRLSAE